MERGDPEQFDRLGTLGVEEEFFLVDDDGRPTAGIDDLVYGSEPPAPLDGRLDHELFRCIIETQTPLIEAPGSARETLLRVRRALVEHAAAHGYEVAAAGLHPVARWRELEHTQKPRYRSQLDRLRYPQQRNTTAGLHVHVGVDDPDKAGLGGQRTALAHLASARPDGQLAVLERVRHGAGVGSCEDFRGAPEHGVADRFRLVRGVRAVRDDDARNRRYP
jgi:Uncharacterized conserved protein